MLLVSAEYALIVNVKYSNVFRLFGVNGLVIVKSEPFEFTAGIVSEASVTVDFSTKFFPETT